VAAAFATLWRPAQRERPRATNLVSWALWGVVLLQLLQLVPLPAGLHRALSPHGYDVWRKADVLLGSSGAVHPLSLDPAGTCFSAATSIAVALSFETAARVARHRGGYRAVLQGVAIVVGGFALLTLTHRLFGATKLYGFYAPKGRFDLISPLLNPNHVAALACVGPPLMLGIAARSEAPEGTLFAWMGAAITGVVALLSLSRGGIAVLVAELVAMSVLLAMSRRASFGARVAPAGIAGIIALTAAYLAFGALARELYDTDVSKLRLARASYAAVRDYALLGAGRGSFGTISSAYTVDLAGWARFAYAEHWPAQLATELGVPATVGFCGLIGLAVFRAARSHGREPHVLGALIALGGLVVHDLADFSMEFAGVGMVAATLLAVVVSEPEVRRERATRRPAAGSPWRRRSGLVMAATVPIALLYGSWGQTVQEETEAVAALPQGTSTARSAMTRHPAEAYFPMMVGSSALGAADASAFLVHAAQLAPGRPAVHYWLARWFWGTGRRPQAYAEYRLAVRLHDEMWPIVLEELVRAQAPLVELEAFALNPAQLDSVASTLMIRGRDAEGRLIDARLIREFPPAIPAHLREIGRLRSSENRSEARALAEKLAALAPADVDAQLALAGLLTPAEGEAMLARALQRIGDDDRLLSAWMRLLGAHADPPELMAPAERLRAALALAGKSPHLATALLGDIAVGRNRKAAALRHYLDAAAASPDGTANLEQAARIAEQLGEWRIAVDAWAKLAQIHPDEPRFAKESTRAREAMQAAAPMPH
jgi:hypothetical protein